MIRNVCISVTLLLSVIFAGCVSRSGKRDRKSAMSTSVPYRAPQSRTRGNVPPNVAAKMSGPQIFERFNSAVFMIITSDGKNRFQGSGFFIDTSGIAVSNYHVFEGTYIGQERIKLTSGDVLTVAEIIESDKENDFIIFRVNSNGRNFNHIPISRRSAKVGERVYAIGSPLGLENTFSSGEISQLRGRHLIQVSVPIDHGSSGGVLINEYGEAIGITTGGHDDSGANLNFAVSIEVVKPYL